MTMPMTECARGRWGGESEAVRVGADQDQVARGDIGRVGGHDRKARGLSCVEAGKASPPGEPLEGLTVAARREGETWFVAGVAGPSIPARRRRGCIGVQARRPVRSWTLAVDDDQ